MSANLNTPETNRPISMGVIWNRLHSEREEVGEALLKDTRPLSESRPEAERTSQVNARIAANWHRELLQARLRKIDDALDRLISGSYGHCVECGRRIEEAKLLLDPAIAFCVECWRRQQTQNRAATFVSEEFEPKKTTTSASLNNELKISSSLPGVALETLQRFDTVQVQTANSHYRIFLLEPRTGRVLVEGGRYFVEPVEALIRGSNIQGSTLGRGWIGIGLRIEMWVEGKLASTSPVKSIHVQRHTGAGAAAVLNPQAGADRQRRI
ncbi:MAG: TraR/DksA C4-type zinc finger protein [Pyrinomonadaceae bacterium]